MRTLRILDLGALASDLDVSSLKESQPERGDYGGDDVGVSVINKTTMSDTESIARA